MSTTFAKHMQDSIRRSIEQIGNALENDDMATALGAASDALLFAKMLVAHEDQLAALKAKSIPDAK